MEELKACHSEQHVQLFGKFSFITSFNPILHTVGLDIHALTLKSNIAKCYFGEKSGFLHTFLKFCLESKKIQVKFKTILFSVIQVF